MNVAKTIEGNMKNSKKNRLLSRWWEGRNPPGVVLNEVCPGLRRSPGCLGAEGVIHMEEISRRPGETAEAAPPPPQAIRVIANVKAEKRDALFEDEALNILEACGISVPRRAFAQNLEEALKAGANLYPLAMKIGSPDIIHKTDVGGVALNIHNEEELLLKLNAMTQQIKSVRPGAKIQAFI